MWRNLRSALRGATATDGDQTRTSEELVCDLAQSLLERGLEGAADELLGELGRHFRAERCAWSRVVHPAPGIDGWQWSAAGAVAAPAMAASLAGHEDEIEAHLLSGPLLLTGLADLPLEAGALRVLMERRSLRSALLVPAVRGDRVAGWLAIEVVSEPQSWDEGEIALLRRLADLFAAAHDHRDRDRRLETLARAVEENPAAVLIVDPDFRIEYANPRYRQGRDGDAAELRGQLFELPRQPEVAEGVYADLWGAVTSGRQWRGELITGRRDGDPTWETVTIRPLRSPGGVVAHHLVIIEDASERRRSEESLTRARDEADQANQAKSDFLANMSHELRTPVNAIVGLSRLTLQTELSERQHDHLVKIRDAAQHLLGIVGAVLDYAIIDAGRMAIESFDFHLDDVLENLGELLESKARDKGLELAMHTAEEVPRQLVGDPFRIGQVLLNLVNNAVKFTDRGRVTVSCTAVEVTPDHAALRFAVADTGIGLSSADIGRLFEPFTQVDASLTRPHGGTGLGLAISRRLVELMGGEIGVTSAPGTGSEFFFTLRLRRQGISRLPLPQPHPDLRGMHVLVVDDSRTARRTLCETLEAFTFQPTAVATAEEALAEVRRASGGPSPSPFEVVLMDWKMPAMDGLEAARRIKSELAAPPRIILVTGFGREDVIHQADRDLLDGFLLKPVNASLLFDAIMSAVGRDRPPAGAEAVTPTPPVTPPCPAANRVLVVEDNLLNQEVAEELLSDMGFAVTLADNGQDALALLKSRPFDLVLMDVQMPLMDGFEATRAIRADASLAAMPVVAMTAHAMSGDRARCLEAGMDDYVSKPIDTDRLTEVLSRWLVPRPVAPAAPAAGDGDGLPASLPGINLAAGLSRVGGNCTLFRRLLIEFLHDYRDVARTIRTAVELGHDESGLRLLHTLKGVAATLGADGVHVAARDLEAGLRTGPLDNRKALLGNLERALAPVLDGLQALAGILSDSERRQQPPARALDVARIRPLLVELLLLLEDGDPEAAGKLGAVAATLTDAGFAGQVANLERHVHNFDFDEAAVALRELSEAIGYEPGATTLRPVAG